MVAMSQRKPFVMEPLFSWNLPASPQVFFKMFFFMFRTLVRVCRLDDFGDRALIETDPKRLSPENEEFLVDLALGVFPRSPIPLYAVGIARHDAGPPH